MNYYMNNMFSFWWSKLLFFIIGIAVISAFFNIALSAAILFFVFLFSLTLAVILKLNIGTRKLFVLLVIALLAHGAVVFLIYFSGFRPVGGGADYEVYHGMATQIAQRTWAGNFSLDNVRGGHDFTVLVGLAYALFYPDMLVGSLLILWFFCLAVIFSYLIARELGCSFITAFTAGILISLYPSYLYFGSLLLKDTVVIALALFALLLGVKMLKDFSWSKFLLFFIVLIVIIHLRFYIGYAIMFSFVISWFLVSNFDKKFLYGFYILFLLGFSPAILGNGYYGVSVLAEFITPEQITIYREIAYNPDSPYNENENPISRGQPIPGLDEPKVELPAPNPQKPDLQSVPNPSQPDLIEEAPSSVPLADSPSAQPIPSGFGSSFVIETGLQNGVVSFVKNYLRSFAYGSLGPFPWQFKYQRQQIALFETIPWYIIILFFCYSFFKSLKEKNVTHLALEKKISIFLIIFGVLAMAGLSLFINNYGIIMRIRIPIFISFIIAGCAIFNSYLENFLRKIPWLKNT